LSASGHVAPAKVRGDVDPGELREASRVVQLDREAAIGAVTNRLSMTADGRDLFCRDTACREHAPDRMRVDVGELERHGSREVEPIVARLAEREDPIPKLRRKR